MNRSKDYEVTFSKVKDKVTINSKRKLSPIEILEIIANMVQLVPNEMREMAIKVVMRAIEEKEKKKVYASA